MSLDVSIGHRFPSFEIAVAFSAPAPGITVLFGASGAGKSTVITAVAGLLRPQHCRVRIGPEVLADTNNGTWTAPENRRVGMVFQDARLFPHLSVADNLRYGLRRAKVRGRIDFAEVVDLLGIEPLLGRRTHALSGGERQRVAIGRALLAQPRLLLMDEPLASLDAPRKAEILPYLIRLKARLDLPVLYVTHALDELVQLADYAVLLAEGRVQAAGPVEEIAARADLPLAGRADAAAVLACTIAGHEPERQLTRLAWGDAVLWVVQIDRPVGAKVRLRIPAREVILARAGLPLADSLSVHNVVSGVVRAVAPRPPRHTAMVEVTAGGGSLLAHVTPDAVQRLGLAPNVPVAALIKSMAIEVIGDTDDTDDTEAPPAYPER